MFNQDQMDGKAGKSTILHNPFMDLQIFFQVKNMKLIGKEITNLTRAMKQKNWSKIMWK